MLHHVSDKPSVRLHILAGAVTLALSQTPHAAGFALIEQSVSGMGTAYAGGAAFGEDNSAMYFNPAAMAMFKGSHVNAGMHIVVPQSEFKDGGSTFAPALGGASLGSNESDDAGVAGLVPHSAYSTQINDTTWVGITINAPFGLSTEYDSDWIGRYHAIDSEVKSLNVNPAIAVKVNDRLTVGAGISAQYLKARLSNAVDYGSIDAALLGGGAGLAGPGSADGEAVVKGDSWAWGFNLGLLYDLSDDTRLGMQYRSSIDHEVEGRAKFGGAGAAAVSQAIFFGLGEVQFANADVSSDVTMPATASISVYHQVSPQWSLMADYTWTGWSDLDELRFEFDSDQSDSVTTFAWDDTSRVAAGVMFSPSASNWVFRAGVAYDESPIPNAEHRTPRLPGEDRVWVAIGAGYSPSKNLRFDFGYAHLFVDDPEINKTASLVPAPNEDALRGSLQGSYDASVDIISAQVSYFFD